MKLFTLLLICIMFCGCSIHYRNQKGIRIKGKDFETRAGTVEKGKIHFWSEVDLWFPWKPRNYE